ncbi:glycosyltransferase [Chryseobacterium wangxinyae]|uniref:glycosyltransferase n=1 Tax=Chryseobacterium sp. CY353 TaxID=2997334 RepID=UPI0022712FD3|nr:glycosyltransferase [Chryseobacterium sp. CY353]MCY0970066.1 glycosyltransferase [Chryseobacterium sp. CY353]
MRILHIDNSLGTGGAEKLLLDTIPLYRKAGIEMDLLLLWDNDLPFTKELRKLDCCNIFVLRKSENEKDVYNPALIFDIKKIIKNYDIAHLHVFPSQYYAVFANLLNGSKTKLILTEHNTSNGRVENKIFRPLEKFIYSKYEKVICITKQIEIQYKKYLGLSDKLITINNGVDVNKIIGTKAYDKSDFGYSKEDKLLIMVARFNRQKDQDTIIRTLKILPESYKFILAGDGKRRGELEKLVAELDLSHRVNFLGIRSDIYSLYKMCDLAILSSHWEGFGLAAVEAMACKIPTIASNVDGLAQVVDNAGILFETENSNQLAEIVLSLEDNEKYQSVAEKCFERAKQFDIMIMVNKSIALYKSVIEK